MYQSPHTASLRRSNETPLKVDDGHTHEMEITHGPYMGSWVPVKLLPSTGSTKSDKVDVLILQCDRHPNIEPGPGTKLAVDRAHTRQRAKPCIAGAWIARAGSRFQIQGPPEKLVGYVTAPKQCDLEGSVSDGQVQMVQTWKVGYRQAQNLASHSVGRLNEDVTQMHVTWRDVDPNGREADSGRNVLVRVVPPSHETNPSRFLGKRIGILNHIQHARGRGPPKRLKISVSPQTSGWDATPECGLGEYVLTMPGLYDHVSDGTFSIRYEAAESRWVLYQRPRTGRRTRVLESGHSSNKRICLGRGCWRVPRSDECEQKNTEHGTPIQKQDIDQSVRQPVYNEAGLQIASKMPCNVTELLAAWIHGGEAVLDELLFGITGGRHDKNISRIIMEFAGTEAYEIIALDHPEISSVYQFDREGLDERGVATHYFKHFHSPTLLKLRYYDDLDSRSHFEKFRSSGPKFVPRPEKPPAARPFDALLRRSLAGAASNAAPGTPARLRGGAAQPGSPDSASDPDSPFVFNRSFGHISSAEVTSESEAEETEAEDTPPPVNRWFNFSTRMEKQQRREVLKKFETCVELQEFDAEGKPRPKWQQTFGRELFRNKTDFDRWVVEPVVCGGLEFKACVRQFRNYREGAGNRTILSMWTWIPGKRRRNSMGMF